MRTRAALGAAALLATVTATLVRADAPGSTPGVDCVCPRAPVDRLADVRAKSNPFPATPENVTRGRELYLGKGYCAVCHGLDGRGFAADVDRTRIQGVLPRDFSDSTWQAVRADGEIHWAIANGVPGTAMASFVPRTLSADEAWLVVLWLRTRTQGAR